MAATARIKIDATITNLPAGSETVDIPLISLTSAIGEIRALTLASGVNQIAVPTGTTVILFVPPVANAVVLTLGVGLTGGTIGLKPALPQLLCVDPALGWFYLNAAAIVTGCYILFL